MTPADDGTWRITAFSLCEGLTLLESGATLLLGPPTEDRPALDACPKDAGAGVGEPTFAIEGP